MKASALYGAIAALGFMGSTASTPASAVPPAPALFDPAAIADEHGVALAAARAATTGVSFGRCAPATGLPAPIRCGTVSVPLDYARPDGPQIDLTIDRLPATGPADQRQGS